MPYFALIYEVIDDFAAGPFETNTCALPANRMVAARWCSAVLSQNRPTPP